MHSSTQDPGCPPQNIFSAWKLPYKVNLTTYAASDDPDQTAYPCSLDSVNVVRRIFRPQIMLVISVDLDKGAEAELSIGRRSGCSSWETQSYDQYYHYENTPIQIYRKFHLQKLKNFRQKTLIFFLYFCSKHRLRVLVRTASSRRF